MTLSPRSLEWLRDLDHQSRAPDSSPRFDLVDSAHALGLMAQHTPAWTERYVTLLDQLIERHTGGWSAADWMTEFGLDLDRDAYLGAFRTLMFNAFVAAGEAAGPGLWSRLSAVPMPSCPQVVDVDFPTVALTRAEWVRGALHLRLSPLVANPDARTTFRIVGAEPRMWDLIAPDGTTLEMTAKALHVRVPLVHADLEFTPGSY